jgi:phosphatidylcholine synthase
MVEPNSSGAGRRLIAWAIHLLTASGAVIALLALAAVEGDRWREALLWLLAALVIDGVDGTLARWAEVKKQLPQIDGSALDLVVDYLTYVFVPAWFLWRFGAFPDAMALPLVAFILLSSLYTFARRDMKTEDGYFRGFPALWNIVALYVFAAQPAPWLAGLVTLVLVVMTFAPVHTVHPMRVRDYGPVPATVTMIWGLATIGLLMPLGGSFRGPLLVLSLVTAATLVVMGLLRSLRGPRGQSG